jgi:hypothetical protein
LGVLGPQQSAILSPKAKPPTGRHFAQCPAGGLKTAPDATALRPFCLDTGRAGAVSFGHAQQSRSLTQNAPKPNNAWWRSAGTGNCNPPAWIGTGQLGKGSGNSRVSMSLPAIPFLAFLRSHCRPGRRAAVTYQSDGRSVGTSFELSGPNQSRPRSGLFGEWWQS